MRAYSTNNGEVDTITIYDSSDYQIIAVIAVDGETIFYRPVYPYDKLLQAVKTIAENFKDFHATLKTKVA